MSLPIVNSPLNVKVISSEEQVEAALQGAGFTKSTSLQEQLTTQADNDNLSHNGSYVVLAAWNKGLVNIFFEQNTAVEVVGGLEASVQHPAVAVIMSNKGRVACNPSDFELILNVAADLA